MSVLLALVEQSLQNNITHHHHHHHPRISLRRKSWNKTSGPLHVIHQALKMWNVGEHRPPSRQIRFGSEQDDFQNSTLGNSLSKDTSSPVAGPITLFGLLTIISLLFSIVLSVSMKFSHGCRSPPMWLFQNPRWPPWTYKSILLRNVRSISTV